jgi:fatty-acyl-CoA synthase
MGNLSHVVGAKDPGLLHMTIGQALEDAARRWDDQEALVSLHQGVRLTWTDLLTQADSFAAGLIQLGLRAGDRVGVWAPNCVEWSIAQFATARAGMILVNINPAYRLSELEYTLRKVGVRALVCMASFKTSDYVAMTNALAPEIASARPGELHAAKLPDLRMVIKIGGARCSGWLDFDQVFGLATVESRTRLAHFATTLDEHDPINIQFTSGTTGSPKGATLSHHNILNNAFFVGAAMGLRAGDRLCIPVPLYHCFGMVMGNLACLTHGATMVYPAASFEPRAVLSAIEKERCTALHGVPMMFIAELQDPEFATFDLSSLRTGLMAGSPCPIEVLRQVIEKMNMREVGIAYGMTETSPVSFQTAADDSLERRVSTIGQVQPHLEVKVIDLEGNTTPRGVPGELCTKGYSVMRGYWNDEERTREAIDADGWMHTGDIGVLDNEGYGNIVGRIKDMMIRGGENIYPREIEEFLFKHESTADVQVFGVPDDRFGEEVCAWIRLKPGAQCTEEELIEFCRGQIAHYKIPRYVRFVDEFPTTVTGKAQKFAMRDAMIVELGLREAVTA